MSYRTSLHPLCIPSTLTIHFSILHSLHTSLDAFDIEHRMDFTPVVFTRQWLDPSLSQVKEMIDYDVLLHSTICALDTDGFLTPREELVRTYLRHGGQVVLRVVTFHFDDTTEKGLRLWDKQDYLMSGAFGSVGDLRSLVLENPARLIRGKKQRTPTWKCLPDWAYHKAPTAKDHRFSAYNHNWTAGSVSRPSISARKKVRERGSINSVVRLSKHTEGSDIIVH